MAQKPGLTRVATSSKLPQAEVRTLALDTKAISVGRAKPQPEIVVPPEVTLGDWAENSQQATDHPHRAWLKTVIGVLIFVLLALVFYFYFWETVALRLGIITNS